MLHCLKVVSRAVGHLWKILKAIWHRGRVAEQWRFMEGVCIPKEENSRNISQFWTISLYYEEGKIFFNILSQTKVCPRESSFWNNYINTLVQRGGIPRVPSCLEHTGVVTQIIREARDSRGDSVPFYGWTLLMHMGSYHINCLNSQYIANIIIITLLLHNITNMFPANLILNYYNGFWLTISLTSSDWHYLELAFYHFWLCSRIQSSDIWQVFPDGYTNCRF